jgi:hypothetical protein
MKESEMVKEPNVEGITKDARSIAEVLAKHNVFGVVADDASTESKSHLEMWIAHEKDHFIGMVLRQATDPYALGSMKLSYRDTGVFVEFDIQVISDTARFAFIKAVPLLSPNPTLAINPNIDYEVLKADIQFVLEYNAVE